MRKPKFQLDRRSLQIIYLSFVRPLLEYADVVWDNCFQYEVNELEKIQNEAARIVTGSTKLVSINNLLKETGWESLSTRRKEHKLTLFYKMNDGLCPNYLISLVPNLSETIQLTVFETLQTSKPYMLNRSSTITHFYRQLFETGMSYQ